MTKVQELYWVPRLRALEVIGIDFAGPIKYRIRAKTEGKAYLALCACSLTQGLFLEVLPNLATSEFLRS